MNNEILNWKTLTQRMRHLQLIHLIELHCLEVLEGLDFHSSIIFNSVCSPPHPHPPTLLALKFKWPESDRSNIASHCCYFPGSKYIVKIRTSRERGGERRKKKKKRSHGIPSPFVVSDISIGQKSVLNLIIYRELYKSE